MALPKRLGVLLDDLDPKDFGGQMFAGAAECEGAKFHSPNPLVLREVKIGKRKAVLCSTCAENLHILAALHEQNDGFLPWETRREFGNQIRALHKEMTGG